MSDTHDEAAAQQAEQDRTDELARQNEEVRRAEHPEEFAEAADEPASVAPVAPASGTVADTTDSSSTPDPAELEKLAELERTAATTTLEHVRTTLEGAARELRRKLFGEPTL